MPDSAQERKTEDVCQHNFSDCSGPFAARVCSLQAVRSLSGFAPPALSPLLRAQRECSVWILPKLVAPETDLNLAPVVGDGHANRAKP